MADRAFARTVYRGHNLSIFFKPDKKGIAGVALSGEVEQAVKSVAEAVAKPYAISVSPTGPAEGGHYRDNFDVDMTHVRLPKAYPMLRWAATLINTSPYAARVERGTKKNKGIGHRVLGRTLDHLDGQAR